MPTYDYKCSNCNHTFEIYQSMNAAKLTECPECHKNTLERLIGAGSGLIFKGTGFYLTDYKNKPTETSSSNTSSSTSKKENSAEKNQSGNAESKSSSDSSQNSGSDPKKSGEQKPVNKSENKSSEKNSPEGKKTVKKEG